MFWDEVVFGILVISDIVTLMKESQARVCNYVSYLGKDILSGIFYKNLVMSNL